MAFPVSTRPTMHFPGSAGRRDIAPPLLRQIAKDIGMTVQEFLSYR